jgi:pre-mRNA-processing factor SLU7
VREAVGYTKHQEGDEIEFDKDRLKRALEEEKKRKNMGEEEAWKNTKKSRTDVSQEEMGEFSYTVAYRISY